MATTKNKPRVEQAEVTSKGKRPRTKVPTRDYTAEEKQKAITAMLTTNRDHPMGIRALTAARQSIGASIHHETLRTWLKEYRAIIEATLTTKPATQIILDQQADTLSRLAAARDLALDQITDKDKAKAASYRDSAVVFGITDDHLKTATSITPSVIALWQEYERTCEALGVLPEDMFKDVTVWLKSRLPNLQSIASRAQQQADNTTDTPIGDNVK